MAENLANDVQTLLSGAINNSVTSITTAGATGMPAANFRVRVDDEIMLVTSTGSGANWTVTRGAEGTTAAAHVDQAIIVHVLSKGGFDQYLIDRYPFRNFIDGFTLNPASTTTYDIGAGAAMDSTNALVLNSSAGLTGKSQAAWAVGASAGGKLSAAALVVNTWYYWFALLKDADGTVDFGFDVSTTPTLPTGYTKYRYIGARKTLLAATTWEPMFQHGDEVHWSTPPALDVNGAPSSASRTLQAVNTPAVRVKWYGRIHLQLGAGSAQSIIFTDPSCADVAPSGGAIAPIADATFSNTTSTTILTQWDVDCWTNTANQVGLRGQNNTVTFALQTRYFIDPRGKTVS